MARGGRVAMGRRSVLEVEAVEDARGRAARRPVEAVAAPPLAADGSNPTFGLAYWPLGLLAAGPALLGALGFLIVVLRPPQARGASFGIVLGVLIAALALGAIVAHLLDYPAWIAPGVTLLPVYALFLPAAVLHGQWGARVNGDPDPIVAVPFAATWALLAAAAIVTVAVAFAAGRHAPSFSGSALLPLPLLLAWTLVLAPAFDEGRVARAVVATLALTACATLVAWLAPAPLRPLAPLAAIAAQFALFWWLRLGWPAFGGAIAPIVWLDLALFLLLVVLIGLAPPCAAWVRRAGWPAAHRLLRG